MSRIKIKFVIVGVGGAGGNAIIRLLEADIPYNDNIRYVAINTDVDALGMVHDVAQEHDIDMDYVLLADDENEGLGAGGDPRLAAKIANEYKDEIAQKLTGADIIMILAGLGGGTGTGASPIVASIAKQLPHVSVLSIVILPAKYEGTRREKYAEEALSVLKNKVDTYIAVSNQKVFEANKKLTRLAAFQEADNVIYESIYAILKTTIERGHNINIDFHDIENLLQKYSGAGLIGIGESNLEEAIQNGKNPIFEALLDSISNPYLSHIHIDYDNPTHYHSSRYHGGIIIAVGTSKGIKMMQFKKAVEKFKKDVLPGVSIVKFGDFVFKDMPEDMIEVILIGSGF